MANLRFYYDNKFDGLTASDVTVSSAVATLPKDFLFDGLRTRVWRSTGAVAESVAWDFGQEENCQYIGLVNHNLTNSGLITVTASNNADFSSPEYTEEFEAWDPVYGFGEGGFGEFGFGGYIPNDQLSELALGPVRVLHFDTVIARYWRIELEDDDNESGYFELGRIFNGLYWEPARQFKFGWVFLPMDESEIEYSAGRQKWADTRPERNKVIFEISVTKLDLWWKAVDMLRRWGKRKDVIISLFPEGDPSARFFTTMYGRFEEIPEIEGASGNNNPMIAVFEESR